MKLLKTGILCILALSFFLHPLGAATNDGAGASFSYNLRTLMFFDEQSPAHSTLNPENAFLKLYRYSAEVDVRPDLFFEMPSVSALFKPRMTYGYRWWEDGVMKGERDSQSRAFVNEWRVQARATSALFVSFGKEKLLWGPSFLASPSNILFKDIEKVNPKTEVEGKYLARLMYLPDAAFTFTAISGTQSDTGVVQENDKPTRALKADWVGTNAAAALIVYFKQHDRFRLGSYGQWTASDAVVLYYDGLVSKGTGALYPVQDPASPLGGTFVKKYDDSGRLFTTVTTGGSYTFLSGSTVSLEFLYNGAGYGDADAGNYYFLRENAGSHLFDGGVISGLSQQTLADALNTGLPFLRRYYLMGQYQVREIGNVLDIVLRYTHGLEEHAGQASSILEWRFSDRMQFFNINTVGIGKGKETEFNSILTRSFLAGIEAHF